MHHDPKPDTAYATFMDGSVAVRLSFPADEAASWRSATVSAIVGRLGLAVFLDPVVSRPNGTDAARTDAARFEA